MKQRLNGKQFSHDEILIPEVALSKRFRSAAVAAAGEKVDQKPLIKRWIIPIAFRTDNRM